MDTDTDECDAMFNAPQ